jgi:drug/metabolite transporter (DMT)-like permease
MTELPTASTVHPVTAPPLAREQRSRYRWLVLALGIVVFSTASILTRLADAPPLVVGAWRMALATILLTPWALPRFLREFKALGRHDVLVLILAGTALALHFATWISSLALTTVASSVILVTTSPIFVGLASHFILKQRISARQVSAIVMAMAGSVVVSYGDLGLSGKALLGDLLALAGAVMASAYFLLGTSIRRKISTLAYVWPCYGIAALLLLAFCIVGGQPLTGYGNQVYLIFLLLALGPQVLGHSSFNWALAQFSPLMVTLAILGEPVGASILAVLVLGELPPLTAPLGGLLILAGIYLASRDELKSEQGEPR